MGRSLIRDFPHPNQHLATPLFEPDPIDEDSISDMLRQSPAPSEVSEHPEPAVPGPYHPRSSASSEGSTTSSQHSHRHDPSLTPIPAGAKFPGRYNLRPRPRPCAYPQLGEGGVPDWDPISYFSSEGSVHPSEGVQGGEDGEIGQEEAEEEDEDDPDWLPDLSRSSDSSSTRTPSRTPSYHNLPVVYVPNPTLVAAANAAQASGGKPLFHESTRCRRLGAPDSYEYEYNCVSIGGASAPKGRKGPPPPPPGMGWLLGSGDSEVSKEQKEMPTGWMQGAAGKGFWVAAGGLAMWGLLSTGFGGML